MIKNFVRLVYAKFGYFLMILLGLIVIFNGTSTINNWIAIPTIAFIVMSQILIVVIVEFNGSPEDILVKFLKRFIKADVLIACIMILIYIGGCNNWLDVVN